METKKNLIKIIKVTKEDILEIQSIAHETWPNTFGETMSKEQIDYMLDLFYNDKSLENQMTELKHQFKMAYLNEKAVGFVSYELNYQNLNQLMIHKIYISPSAQGNGIGKKIFENLELIAKKNGQKFFRLKVYIKNKKAIDFYLKRGFKNQGIEYTDIKKYVIEDYVMLKELK
ncbi:GNAT family N-acetyltransferase [Aureivirga sp. CE67]|uniref:GNAT family N-acetyltransferase n=1 Tax=Aureivirga sp. CE67 TaxID=1788983 RepID=UPI0018CAEE04|nr:GNAT family N-acetyltransferase [Aureivirga sp. CE67]